MTREAPIWRQLELTAPREVDAFVDVLRAICTLPGSPKVVLEATATNGEIRWQVATLPRRLHRLEHVLTTHLSEVYVSIREHGPTTATSCALLFSIRIEPNGCPGYTSAMPLASTPSACCWRRWTATACSHLPGRIVRQHR